MILWQDITLGSFEPCEYLPDRDWRFQYFFAGEVGHGELEALLARGYSEQDCEKIMGGNFLRVFGQVCGERAKGIGPGA